MENKGDKGEEGNNEMDMEDMLGFILRMGGDNDDDENEPTATTWARTPSKRCPCTTYVWGRNPRRQRSWPSVTQLRV